MFIVMVWLTNLNDIFQFMDKGSMLLRNKPPVYQVLTTPICLEYITYTLSSA